MSLRVLRGSPQRDSSSPKRTKKKSSLRVPSRPSRIAAARPLIHEALHRSGLQSKERQPSCPFASFVDRRSATGYPRSAQRSARATNSVRIRLNPRTSVFSSTCIVPDTLPNIRRNHDCCPAACSCPGAFDIRPNIVHTSCTDIAHIHQGEFTLWAYTTSPPI